MHDPKYFCSLKNSKHTDRPVLMFPVCSHTCGVWVRAKGLRGAAKVLRVHISKNKINKEVVNHWKGLEMLDSLSGSL